MNHCIGILLVCLIVGTGLLLLLFNTTNIEQYKRPTPTTCNVGPFISFRPQGRLGNLICEYIHLIHASNVSSIQAFIHPEMWTCLHDSFPSISLPLLSEDCLMDVERHEVQYGKSFGVRANNFTSMVLLKGSPCDPKEFWPSREQWQQELVFSPQLQGIATARRVRHVRRWQRHHKVLQGLSSSEQAPTVVGVHVRRGDYHKLLVKYHFDDLLPPEYYHRAFQHFRERYAMPLFFIFTEPSQRAWCNDWLVNGTSDVVLVRDSTSPINDMALLASMEHIVYSHGTFGLMAILLSNIKTLVYPAKNPQSTARRYLPYIALDDLSKNWTSVEFVTVASTKSN